MFVSGVDCVERYKVLFHSIMDRNRGQYLVRDVRGVKGRHLAWVYVYLYVVYVVAAGLAWEMGSRNLRIFWSTRSCSTGTENSLCDVSRKSYIYFAFLITAHLWLRNLRTPKQLTVRQASTYSKLILCATWERQNYCELCVSLVWPTQHT